MFHHVRKMYPHEELAAALARHGDWSAIADDQRARFAIVDAVVVGLLHRFDPRRTNSAIKPKMNQDQAKVRALYKQLVPLCAEVCAGDVERICRCLPIEQVGALTVYHLSNAQSLVRVFEASSLHRRSR